MSGPICIGDPDGVPESRHVALEIGGTVHFTLPDTPAGAFVVTDADEHSVTMTWHSKPDPAALLGPVREPVDWNPRDAAGDEEC